jgi:hypothetical protein
VSCAPEASPAGCCRNHIGPLIAVHKSSVSGTSDKIRGTEFARH